MGRITKGGGGGGGTFGIHRSVLGGHKFTNPLPNIKLPYKVVYLARHIYYSLLKNGPHTPQLLEFPLLMDKSGV